jgi:preprotein translocase subunit SecD
LGADSIKAGLIAGVVGAVGVMLIMQFCYGLSGLLANLMLTFTIGLLFAGLGLFGATLTLPGIAGVVLTIGMSVDANVLVFERIREEIGRRLPIPEAVAAGFREARSSILDANFTTLLTAAVLYQFGTGPIRGFAVTLALGIIASMFTAIFVSHLCFDWWIRKNGAVNCGLKPHAVADR